MSCKERKTSSPGTGPLFTPTEPSQAWLRVRQSSWSLSIGPIEISWTFSHLFYMLPISQPDMIQPPCFPTLFPSRQKLYLVYANFCTCANLSKLMLCLSLYFRKCQLCCLRFPPEENTGKVFWEILCLSRCYWSWCIEGTCPLCMELDRAHRTGALGQDKSL